MAATRKTAAKSPTEARSGWARLVRRTPIAEWVAASLGLALTLGVLGYSLWEAATDGGGAPSLSLEAGTPAATGDGFVLPVTLRNDSDATAATVWVSGVLERDGQPIETRRAMFDYAPGKGEVRGGLIFRNDPAAHRLRLVVEGFQEP